MNIEQPKPINYICKVCNFKCTYSRDFERHKLTNKHKTNILVVNNELQQNTKYSCSNCNKFFKDRSGLWKHNKKCIIINQYNNNNEELIPVIDTNLIMQILKQNSEFKDLILEQSKQIVELSKNNNITNNIVNSNNNNNNTQFNLQFFLNETCKDAMSITEFVESLKPTLYDLEETGRLGYSEGITRIIVNGLKELDVTKRPIHCSDLKRETMFIKNTETWEKEKEDKPILLKAIKDIGKKNINNIKEWQKFNKNFNQYDSKQNDQYLQIVTNAMSGGTIEEQNNSYNKIIKNIAKETIIDKK
jgi:hypothetical protein